MQANGFSLVSADGVRQWSHRHGGLAYAFSHAVEDVRDGQKTFGNADTETSWAFWGPAPDPGRPTRRQHSPQAWGRRVWMLAKGRAAAITWYIGVPGT